VQSIVAETRAGVTQPQASSAHGVN
jgi:hypothetical protein